MMKESLQRLFALLPEGKRKQELVAKYTQLQTKSQKRGGDGLQDSFEFQPKGHIKIEAIDEKGMVVGVLADQPNLVVDGAEEILLRSFSGDSNRILYKNRKVKDVSGITKKIYILESKLNNEDLFDGSQLLHAPNLLWAEVDDSLFDISYGFYPTTSYVKEEASTESGKKAFSLSNEPAADRVPMNSEIYSTYTNMFIGIGEGKNAPVALTDSRLTATSGFTVTTERAEANVVDEELSFKVKMSNFKLEVEASSAGAQIDVIINGVLKETIETLDSELVTPEVRVFEYNDLDYNTDTEVRLVHSGSDTGVVNPVMAIVGLHFDALDKSMNKLMKEFKNFETEFLTPASYNTTPMAPFTIQLPHFPVKEGSVKITYEGVEFTEAATEAELNALSFVVDELHGVVTFNRALTGVMSSFSSTGELYDTEMVSTMTAGSVSVNIVTPTSIADEVPLGAIDANNMSFTLSHVNIDPATLVVNVDGSPIVPTSFDPVTRIVVLETAPAIGQAILVNYTYNTTTVSSLPTNKYHTALPAIADSVVVMDQDGNALISVTDAKDFGNGKILVDKTDLTLVTISENKADGEPITRIEIRYLSAEQPGVPTNYTRAIIEKPKTVNEYPWFELDKGAVRFVAEFPELKPAHNVVIREMGLFDGPRPEDKIAGFRNYPVKAFSLVRVGETRKEANTGIRITWTITLLNSDGQPFQGGLN